MELAPEMVSYLADLDPGRALAAVVDVYLTDPVGIGTSVLTDAVRAFRQAEAERPLMPKPPYTSQPTRRSL